MTYLRRCKASGIKAGILYMHDIASNPLDTNLAIGKHLTTFYRVYTGRVSSTLVVPTKDRGAKLEDKSIQARISQLTVEAAKSNVTVWKLFDGKPETAWTTVQELLKQMAVWMLVWNATNTHI